jgi:transcriptional regulator with XRE-family HTH domain
LYPSRLSSSCFPVSPPIARDCCRTAYLGLTQRAYAHWERNPVKLRPDQLLNLTQALNVSVEDLVRTNGTKKRGTGPTGKMRQLFEAASRLPRSQQQKIAAIIEPFIAHHAGR